MSLPTMHLEAVLFSAAKPISIDMLEEVFGLSTEETQKYIEELQRELKEQNRGIRLRISGAGVELVSAVECADYVGHIRKKTRSLIAELGHKDTVGRPILYGTTDEFLRSAGVESIEALHQEVSETEG